MRYRDSLREPSLITPGKVYPIDIDLHTTANNFLAGHQIRIEVSSSNFPRLERNLNTGGNIYDEVYYKTALNRVLFGGKSASYIDLPVVQ